MSVTRKKPVITWEKSPDDFRYDEPVDDTIQTPIAVALNEALYMAGRLPKTALASTNIAVCATIDGKLTIKAPDWFYVPYILPMESPSFGLRSYTPYREGDVLAIVMEFLSQTKGEEEYSTDSEPPMGKWYYYEQILQVPTYAIFEPSSGRLEVYELKYQKYRQRKPDENNRYWIAEVELFLGVGQGKRENRTGNWLRWWDENGQILPWTVELLEQQDQLLEQQDQLLEQKDQLLEQEQERERSQQKEQLLEAALAELALLKEKLNSAGINPEDI
ncbi:MAG: hypothetical protein F6J93_36645 [Oscillatoria sp. SIO1A7]|nr:hypothetical protein [Oscillatoria sp. SIO1A7]